MENLWRAGKFQWQAYKLKYIVNLLPKILKNVIFLFNGQFINGSWLYNSYFYSVLHVYYS